MSVCVRLEDDQNTAREEAEKKEQQRLHSIEVEKRMRRMEFKWKIEKWVIKFLDFLVPFIPWVILACTVLVIYLLYGSITEFIHITDTNAKIDKLFDIVVLFFILSGIRGKN